MRRPYRLLDGKEARDYQLRASHKIFTGDLDSRDGTATIIDMGLGKTFIVLQAIADLNNWGILDKPTLVIAPIMVTETVWQQEALMWNTTNWLKFSLLRGSKEERIKALKTPAHIYLINPELLGWLYDTLNGDWSMFDMLVVDESSMFKSTKSKRWQLLANTSKERILKNRSTGENLKDDTGHLIRIKPYKFKRSVIMTGTPSPTSLMNLWPQIYLLDHGKRLHTQFETYRDRFFHKTATVADHVYKYEVDEQEFETRPEWIPKDGAPIKIHELIADITVDLDARDYGILPPVIGDASKEPVPPSHMHLVKLPLDVRDMYDSMEKEALIELGKDFIMAANGGAKTGLCHQIANGFVYHRDEFGTQHTKHLHTLKLDKLDEVLDMLQANVLIPYWFVADKHMLVERFTATKRPFTILTSKNAKEVIADWNKGRIANLLIHPQSASHGLNAQDGGHNVVWYSQIWSLERYRQLLARLARSGQQFVVGNHHIAAEKTVDQLMLMTYRHRGNNQDRFRSALREYQALRGWGIADGVLADVL